MFNKKKIKELEQTVSRLENNVAFLVESLKNKQPYFTIIDKLPEESALGLLTARYDALEKYLGVETKWDWEVDKESVKRGFALLEQENRRRAWKAIKIKKNKKTKK